MTYTKIIRYSITLSIVIALVVLAGWIFHIPLFTTIIPGFPSMRPNTAICFLLLALAMLTQLVGKYAYIRYITLLLLFGLAELSLLETWLNIPLGIDELFFKVEQIPTLTNPYPARIPGFSATCFLLFATGLLIQSFRKSAFTQYIFHLITILGLIASFGYLFGVENMYSLSFLNSMTLHTSILLIILSIAATLFNPTQGLTGLFLGATIGANMAKRLFPAFTLIIFGLGALRIAAHNYNWVSVELGIVLFAISFLVCALTIISYTAIAIDKVDEKRRNAERKLLITAQERLFKDVINNTTSAICIKNKLGEYVLCNDAFAVNFNRTPEEIVGKTAFNLFPYETATKISANEPALFENGETLVYETFAETNHGTKILLTNKFPIYNPHNEITNIGIVATDVTQARLTELNLKAILDSAHVSIIKTDTKGLITVFNKGAEKLLGYSSNEVVGKHTPQLIHVKEEIEVRGNELSAIYGKEITGFDVFITPALYNEFESRKWTYVRKDGSTFPIQLVVTAITNTEKNVIGYLGIGTDITNEEMARSLQHELAIKLQNRNNQLLNFAHITSHNLRSPVSNLVTLVDLLERTQNAEEKDFLFTKFDTVTKRLAATLNDLIEALKIQEDSNHQKETLLFENILSNVKEMLTVQIEDTGTKIETHFTVANMEYPKSYLESIFLNLISNAIKYRSPNRKLEIQIESIEQEDEIILTIKDNGLGIDLKKYGDKVFGFNKTFHRHPEAKGIGLFLTKTQVEAMGGSIRVESEPDIGTSFVINFKK